MMVTTHTGGVDWNNDNNSGSNKNKSHHPHGWCGLKLVLDGQKQLCNRVTTHTGGVDWNIEDYKIRISRDSHHPHGWCGLKSVRPSQSGGLWWSPPTRVVWIEISPYLLHYLPCTVTTHTGGVDWNLCCVKVYRLVCWSPPTRVVWIEIIPYKEAEQKLKVTTHTGGVDWNLYNTLNSTVDSGHHPHGWCGLK